MKILISLILSISSLNAFALPLGKFNALDASLQSSERDYKNDYNFEGIIKLSNCSGSLIAFNGQPLTSKAIVMTNGHCVQKPGGFLNPGEVWVNRPVQRTMRIFDKNMSLFSVQASKILYATMTNTDVAFYELTESYNQIYKKTGISPLILDSVRPLPGQPIEIISGYWDRGYSCDIDDFVFAIKEGSWTFTDSIRYTSGCDTIGGTSGSPIIARGERRVVAINNTSNESGDRCTINNPCELNEAGKISVRKGARYGQQTYQTYGCLTPDFSFELNRSGCELPKIKKLFNLRLKKR